MLEMDDPRAWYRSEGQLRCFMTSFDLEVPTRMQVDKVGR